MRRNPPPMPGQMSQVPPVTPMVKRILIINLSLWFVGAVILEHYVFSSPYLTIYLGLIPDLILKNFYVWQPFTYMFYHSPDLWSMMFSSISLWWFGGELERHWGSRFFLIYYLASGVGAAFLYVLFLLVYSILSGSGNLLQNPVLGSSGAIFGLLVAYGLVFGERIVYFMFVIPVKAKWFVALIGGVVLVLTLNTGVQNGGAANIAHIAGAIAGFLFLLIWTRTRRGPGQGGRGKKKASQSQSRAKLKLVVNNAEEFNDPDSKPKYWN